MASREQLSIVVTINIWKRQTHFRHIYRDIAAERGGTESQTLIEKK